MTNIDKIETINTSSQIWKKITEEDRSSTIFQTPEWIDLELETNNRKNISKLITLDDGRRVILPLTIGKYEEGLRSKIVYDIGGGKTSIYGGCITADDLSVKEREKIREKVAKKVCGGIKPKTFGLRSSPLTSEEGESFTQIIEVEEDFEQTFEKQTSSARQNYRKGKKNNLEIKSCNDSSYLEEFYDIYLENVERWDDPNTVYTKEIFRSILENLPEKNSELRMVQKEDEFIAGLVEVKHQNHTYMFMNCLKYDYRKYYPNNYNITEASRNAIKEDRKYYDMGSSSGIEGLIKFKESFGSEKYYYNSFNRKNRSFRYLKSAVDSLRKIK